MRFIAVCNGFMRAPRQPRSQAIRRPGQDRRRARRRGRHSGALAAYLADLAVAETLARRGPGNALWQRDLIDLHFRIAYAVPAEAEAHLRLALDVARALEGAGRLAPVDAWIPGALKRRLRRIGGEPGRTERDG